MRAMFHSQMCVQRILFILLSLGATLCSQTTQALAQDAQVANLPVGRVLTVSSPITDDMIGQIRRSYLDLQQIASSEKRQAYLILEVQSGTSSFHHCFGLADFLTENVSAQVTTVAWLPKPVSGLNGLVALACQEVVMSPDGSLGDLGSGVAVGADQQQIIKTLIDRRRNPKVTWPLVSVMMNPDQSLNQLTIQHEGGQTESRLATATEVAQLQEDGAVIVNSTVVKEPGTPGILTATEARGRDVLVSRIAASRKELISGFDLSIDRLREIDVVHTSGEVAYIQLHDVIDDLFASFAMRQIERSVKSGAKIIIFEIDTPGGLLLVSQDLAMAIAQLSDRDIRTIAYIPNKAISGGAMLAVACDEIYMSPNATIGDAIPINMMGNMIIHAEGKILSAELVTFRTLAEQKNRPSAILEGFADQDLEVFQVTNKTTGKKWFMSQDEIHHNENEWIPGPIVPESRKGIAITVNGVRAHELLIAQSPVRDITELKERLGFSSDLSLVPIGRNWVDNVVFTLNQTWVVGFLFFLAIIFIYIEMMTMVGFFGIMSGLCFTLFFWSKFMGGTATGLEIVLFLAGLVCVLLEIFVIPGFGVFGVTGILLILTSIVMASQSFTGFSLQYDMLNLGKTLLTLGTSFVAVIGAAALLSKNMHRIPILRELVTTGSHEMWSEQPELNPLLLEESNLTVGSLGQATTILRPSGKAMFGGKSFDVISEGGFIEEGSHVQVIQASRNRIVVRQS